MYKQALRDSVCTGSLSKCRYWSPTADCHATGDQLLGFLVLGWTIESRVEVEILWYGEGRRSLLYHLTLVKDNQRLLMPVLSNPFSSQLIQDDHLALTLVPVRTPRHRIRLEKLEVHDLPVNERLT